MSDNKGANGNGKNGNGKSKDVDNDVPQGFDVRVGREQGEGWLVKEPGATVCGRLLGRFIMKGMTDDDGNYRTFYQIQLNDNAGVYKDGKKVGELKGTRKNEDKEDEDVEFKSGDIINIGEHKALEDLSPRTRDGGVYDVWWRYMNEEKLQGRGNRTFWNLKGPMLKVIKQATRNPGPEPSLRPTRGGGSNGDGRFTDDIPFE